jgi:hypothetical protein
MGMGKTLLKLIDTVRTTRRPRTMAGLFRVKILVEFCLFNILSSPYKGIHVIKVREN